MKEYKVVSCKVGLTNNNERLENTLNEHAKEGWVLKEFNNTFHQIVLEREKNR